MLDEGQKGPQRILLVEDDADIRDAVQELLEDLGHRVQAVTSAEEALAVFTRGAFSLLFSDVTLPGESGVNLARLAVEQDPGLRVILASGHGSAVLPEGPSALRAAVVLPKPFDPQQLERALNRAMKAG